MYASGVKQAEEDWKVCAVDDLLLQNDGPRGKANYYGGLRCTLDHRTPRTKGGAGLPYNCVAACYRCNTAKGPMSAVEFILTAPFIHPPASWRKLPGWR